MNCYLVSYDLRKNRNYDELYKAIKEYGTWAHITESFWAVVTNETAAQVRDNLLKFIDSDDRIIVIKSGQEAAWQNVICTNDWLKKNL